MVRSKIPWLSVCRLYVYWGLCEFDYRRRVVSSKNENPLKSRNCQPPFPATAGGVSRRGTFQVLSPGEGAMYWLPEASVIGHPASVIHAEHLQRLEKHTKEHLSLSILRSDRLNEGILLYLMRPSACVLQDRRRSSTPLPGTGRRTGAFCMRPKSLDLDGPVHRSTHSWSQYQGIADLDGQAGRAPLLDYATVQPPS